ncbi:AraC family transcriptional regulator ligand-binding domain-containing protein [Saccharothrix sp. HUAS TT1]|uniref:AraC family transcriptional regulator n=1 Tax=unclassified Saccharothrix TaxID=2593673 RepID=UPI00345B4E1F
MSVVRSAGLRGFRATVAELGGRAEDYARAAGLPVAALDADDLLVPDRAVAAVLELAAAGLDCPDLGLRVAARQDFGMLGPLAPAIRNSPTVADALESTSRYLFLHARSVSLALVDDPHGAPDLVALHYGVPPDAPVGAQAIDLGLGFLHRSITYLLGRPYGLRSVELPHTPTIPVAVYEEFFGVTVHTGQPAPLLRLPRALLRRPLARGDERVWRLALAFLAEQDPGGASLTARVRGVLTRSLGTVAPEIGAVARLVDLHPRTVQRRLAAEGTTFAAVLDEVRREAAKRYLTTTNVPMSQVAGMLGLSEQSALSRCCRRWWGSTPTAVRRGA